MPIWLQDWTFGLALLGAVLGVINTWAGLQRDRVKVRVITQWALFTGDQQWRLSIEVRNVGMTAVTITGVGFLPRGSAKQTMPLMPGRIGDQLPKRLEPRSNLTIYATPGAEKSQAFLDVRRAFANTACGRRFTGRSRIFKGLRSQLARSKNGP